LNTDWTAIAASRISKTRITTFCAVEKRDDDCDGFDPAGASSAPRATLSERLHD
jgi:hypothetical protein